MRMFHIARANCPKISAPPMRWMRRRFGGAKMVYGSRYLFFFILLAACAQRIYAGISVTHGTF